VRPRIVGAAREAILDRIEAARPFPCPFCGQECRCVTEGELPGVVHYEPRCKVFVETDDAVDFIKACNLEIARKRGVGLT
jgi:hypothetical protein